MKQRIKRFLLTVALCLTLAVLILFFAFTKVDQKVLDSIEQGAKKGISTIMSSDGAMLRDYINQFEANGGTKMADGLKSWQTIREDIGDAAAVDDAVAREMDDDNILVTAKAHCGDREVVAHPRYRVLSGNIAGLNFSKVRILGEELGSAGLNLIIGMGTVFTILTFTAFLISRFKYIHDWASRKGVIEKEEREYKEKVAAIQRMPKSVKNVFKRISAEQAKTIQVPEGTKVQYISAPEETAAEGGPAPAETVAMLTATVAANEESQLDSQMLTALTTAALTAKGEDPEPDGLIVRSLRRCGNSKRRRH